MADPFILMEDKPPPELSGNHLLPSPYSEPNMQMYRGSGEIAISQEFSRQPSDVYGQPKFLTNPEKGETHVSCLKGKGAHT